MKSIAAFLLMLTIVTIASAQNTEVSIPRSLIKLSPQNFINNSLKMGVERFNKDFSRSIVVFILASVKGSNDDIYWRGYNGLGGELQYRKYISPMKQHTRKNKIFYQGIYGAGFIQGGAYSGKFKGVHERYDWTTGTRTSTPYDFQEEIGNWAAGFTLGYHRTFWGVIFVDAYIGGGIQWSDRIIIGQIPEDMDLYTDMTDPDFHGILPKFGVQVGISL